MTTETILGQIAVQGFGGLLANLASEYVKRPGRKINKDKETIKTDLKDHLDLAFRKCTKVKTILSDETSNTLGIYVDQTFSIQNKVIDQYSMVQFIRGGQSTIILGAGGGGKSMFMRYMWLSFFEKSGGKIPFFLELRNINSLSHENIENFIYHSIVKSGSTIRQIDFQASLKAGEFILFLDGFDEINFDRRDKIQDMILDLQDSNPKLTIVVTSRSDERFIGWANFTVARVTALPKEKARLLIERADYSKELKSKFLKKFDKLFELHEDFISNPLLAYMMLVTFSYNPDIPNRMFQFYEQAFEALFHRHDLTKGYKRKFHCDLDKFDFIKLISFFCLKSYYDEKFEFSRAEIIESINESKNIDSISVDSEQFLNDLIQSVCLIKIEGLTFTFTHRSFQEYFAANCIARVAIREIDKLFSMFAKRYGDSVLAMVADINADLFREKYVIPNARKFRKFISRKTTTKLYESFSSRTGAIFTIGIIQKTAKSKNPRTPFMPISLQFKGEMAEFFQVINSVMGSRGSGWHIDGGSRGRDREFLDFVARLLGGRHRKIYVFTHGGALRVSSDLEISSNKITSEEEAAVLAQFRKTLMFDYIVDRATKFLAFVREETEKYDHVSDAFSELF